MVQQQSTLTVPYAYVEIGEAIKNLRAMHDQVIGYTTDFGALSTFVSATDVRSALNDLCLELGITRDKLPPELRRLHRFTGERRKFTLQEVINTLNEARGIPRPDPELAYSPFVDGPE
jgi:hypothetical protein